MELNGTKIVRLAQNEPSVVGGMSLDASVSPVLDKNVERSLCDWVALRTSHRTDPPASAGEGGEEEDALPQVKEVRSPAGADQNLSPEPPRAGASADP